MNIAIRQRRLVQASDRTAVAVLDGELAGFARAITDGLSFTASVDAMELRRH